MTRKTIFNFEEIADDLSRPPIAALRLLWSAGVSVSVKTWQALPLDVRREIVKEGAKDRMLDELKHGFVSGIPVRDVKFVGRSDPDGAEHVPEAVLRQHGRNRPMSTPEWRALRPLERFALTILSKNARLLWRAYQEIVLTRGAAGAQGWSGEVARCELKIRAPQDIRVELLRLLAEERLLEGRAFLLARAAGLRAARKFNETFDLHADAAPGSIELDWIVKKDESLVLWQSHVSTWEGGFAPAASLLAATTSAIALFDMIKEFDPSAGIQNGWIVEEPWIVGRGDWEESTSVFGIGNLKK